MKESFFLFILMFIAVSACQNSSYSSPPASSTTISNDAGQLLNDLKEPVISGQIINEDCPERFQRTLTKEDGSKQIICINPEEFGLTKECVSDSDCSSIEECYDGYCTVVLGGDIACTSNAQCPSGMICSSNFCITN